jgi:signal transduction histidine kinase
MDSEKIKQVILNLLSNAIDFTPRSEKIEIVTRNRKERDKSESVEIEVSDTGEGIPRSNIDSIFDPYFTTKHKSSMHSGTGLGLFIAFQNIENHGGTIEVKSEVNRGTTFIVRLPKSKP